MSIDRLRPLALIGALALAGCAAPPPGPEGGPPIAPSLGWFSDIKAPEGQAAVLRLSAKGVQIFRCEARGKDSIWAFRLPEAELHDVAGKVVGRHGAGYTFEHVDGSRLIGTIRASDPAPGRGNLPWLLLAMRAFGTGAFGGVTYVQRVDTAGGMPPERCDASQRNRLLRVDFSADFVFYRPG